MHRIFGLAFTKILLLIVYLSGPVHLCIIVCLSGFIQKFQAFWKLHQMKPVFIFACFLCLFHITHIYQIVKTYINVKNMCIPPPVGFPYCNTIMSLITEVCNKHQMRSDALAAQLSTTIFTKQVMWLVNVHQSGLYCWSLIGQNMFTPDCS